MPLVYAVAYAVVYAVIIIIIFLFYLNNIYSLQTQSWSNWGAGTCCGLSMSDCPRFGAEFLLPCWDIEIKQTNKQTNKVIQEFYMEDTNQ